MSASTCFDIKTPDGLTLLGRRWPLGSTTPRGRALLLHGVGEHSGRYDEVAAAMTSLGIEVVSYDQRSFGASQGNKGEIPDDTALVADAVFVFDFVRREGPTDPPPFLVAHSMGGTTAAYAVATGLITPRGLVLSSPAFAPTMTELEEHALRKLLLLAPNAPLASGIKPGQVTRDPSEQRKIKADKRMHTTVTPRLAVSIVDQGRATLANPRRIRVPTVLLVAGADLVVDRDTTLRFFARMRPAIRSLHLYKALFHEVFKELPDDRKRVFADFDRSLRRQLGVTQARRRQGVRLGSVTHVRHPRTSRANTRRGRS